MSPVKRIYKVILLNRITRFYYRRHGDIRMGISLDKLALRKKKPS